MAEAPVAPRPKWVNFTTGASAALSGWMFVHPFDLLKVRKQLGGGSASMTSLARQIVQTEGATGLYAGLSAAATRQLTYGNFRLGIYNTLKDTMYGTSDPPATGKLIMGCAAGGVAAFLSNPVEVTLVRMQADGNLPKAERRNYAGIFSGLYRIGVEDGPKAYMAGVVPTMVRAMIVNMLQVGGYDVAKTQYSPFLTGVPLHVLSALTAGFIYSAVTLPIDTAKTRMQNQKPLADGSMAYTSLPQTFRKIAAAEGPLALMNGFGPYFARSGGHTVFMFLFLEQYKKLANAYYPPPPKPPPPPKEHSLDRVPSS